MRAYGYTAYTDAGARRRGTLVAESEAAAAEQLRAQGLYVADLEVRGGAVSVVSGRARLTAELRAVLVRQLAVLLAADLPAEAALDAVRGSAAAPALEAVAARARAALMEGAPLSQALAGSGAGYPAYVIAALRAGEAAGDPGAVLAELADHLESAGTERARIAAALVYPAFVAAVSLLVCAVLLTTVAPEIVAMFDTSGRPLPVLTAAVMGAADWIRVWWPVLAAGAGAFALLLALSARPGRLRDGRDALMLRLPVFGRLMRLTAAVQYLRTLALVLGARHAVLSASASAAEVLTVRRFRAEAEAVTEAVRQGESLSAALARLSLIPPVARQLIAAGEMSARPARMAERAAALVETGLQSQRKRIAALLEPILMILVGAVVLVIVLAILLPIFDLQAVVAG